MADYHPLIAKAVAGLEKNTGEARRALYERARTALVAQLRGVEPALSESDITRERLALEEAIRKVEGEAARRSRTDFGRPAPEPAASARTADEAPDDAPRDRPAPSPPPTPAAPNGRPGGPAAEAAASRAPPPARNRAGARLSLTDQGLKGFRDVIAEADDLGAAAAQAGRSARQAYAAVPAPSPELDRIEPRLEGEGLRGPSREAPGPAMRAEQPAARELPVRPPPPSRPQPPAREFQAARPRPDADDLHPPPVRGQAYDEAEEYEPEPRPPRSYGGLIKAAVAIGVVVVLAGLFYVLWPHIGSLIQAMRSQGGGQTTAAVPPPATKKIPDRAPGAGPEKTAPVAQRVVLYEEDPNDPQGKRFVGTAVWHTETVSPGPGLAPELAVRADVDIPERQLKMQWSLRRNTDKTLPASHTIEIIFTLPPDFPSGGIANVPGILMKDSEQTRGVPLSGLAVKVTTSYFLIGLSAVESDVQRNMELLKNREWFDIPVVYGNNRRAIIAMEKGTPGDRAFAEAFAAWGISTTSSK